VRSIALQPEDVRSLLLAQGVLVALLVGILFATGRSDAAMAAAFGGGIALLSAWLLGVSVRLAAQLARTDPGRETTALYIGAVMRFAGVLVLFAVGMGVLQLSPLPLLGGFAVAQVGHVLNGARLRARAGEQAEKSG
jgi:ATP synthase protein I